MTISGSEQRPPEDVAREESRRAAARTDLRRETLRKQAISGGDSPVHRNPPNGSPGFVRFSLDIPATPETEQRNNMAKPAHRPRLLSSSRAPATQLDQHATFESTERMAHSEPTRERQCFVRREEIANKDDQGDPKHLADEVVEAAGTDAAVPLHAATRDVAAIVIPTLPTFALHARTESCAKHHAAPITTDLIDRIVCFAALGRDSLGRGQMSLGLRIGKGAIVGMTVIAIAPGKVSISTRLGGQSPVGAKELARLVDTLRERGVGVSLLAVNDEHREFDDRDSSQTG